MTIDALLAVDLGLDLRQRLVGIVTRDAAEFALAGNEAVTGVHLLDSADELIVRALVRGAYEVSDEQLKKWIEFLRCCGGFEVW